MSSSESREREREDYEELLMLPGWARYVRDVLESWQGVGYFNRMGSALAKGSVEARALHLAAIEIQRILQIPHDRVEELKGK